MDFYNEFGEWLSRGGAKQLPYAMMRALNSMSFEARRELIDKIESEFTLRSGNFIPRSVSVTKATKDSLEATIGILERAQFLTKHEEGGTITPDKKNLNVPTRKVKGTTKVPRAMRPKALLKREDVFTMNSRKGKVIAQRMPNGGTRTLYGLEEKSTYQPRLHFQDTIESATQKKFSDLLYKYLIDALK
ncbi:hypothetical protein [Novispirillum itersonii]|uniref:hypothetical protein n=1 Tax=Novispirillum itersonii TaxID=189 RepID=UPI0003810A26|nr:hypothetical protein [Novispirillum itersonii]